MKFIAIGASAGGIAAIQELLRTLGPINPVPIGVVQHIPDRARFNLPLIFSNCTQSKIYEIEDKMPIETHSVYFAPSGYHTLVERDGTFALNMDEPVHFSRPSIDVFFESVATAFGKEATGVLMTGASADGAEGLKSIHLCGGRTMVQDPKTAEVAIMPEEALRRFTPTFVLSLSEIGKKLRELTEAPE